MRKKNKLKYFKMIGFMINIDFACIKKIDALWQICHIGILKFN